DAIESRAVAATAASFAIALLDVEAATQLAEAEGLVTHLTSFVLVDEAGVAQEGLPATRKIPLASPRTSARASGAAYCLGAMEADAPPRSAAARILARKAAAGGDDQRGRAGWLAQLRERARAESASDNAAQVVHAIERTIAAIAAKVDWDRA